MAVKLQTAHVTVRDPSDVSTILEGLIRTRGITGTNLKQYQLTEYGNNLFLLSIVYDGGDIVEYSLPVGIGGGPTARRRFGIRRAFTIDTRTTSTVSKRVGMKRVSKALLGLKSVVSALFVMAKPVGWTKTGLGVVVDPLLGVARSFSTSFGSVAKVFTYEVGKAARVGRLDLSTACDSLFGGARSLTTSAGLKTTITYFHDRP